MILGIEFKTLQHLPNTGNSHFIIRSEGFFGLSYLAVSFSTTQYLPAFATNFPSKKEEETVLKNIE